MKKRKVSLIFMVLAVCLAGISFAETMGTAFTYQGRLNDAGDPADGIYDLEFELYDDATAGTQQAGTVNKDDVDVTDGYFTTEVNFGNDPNAFTGESRWLQISIRLGELEDPNGYNTLSPRQNITPAPYALYAGSSNWNNLIDTPADIADGDDDTQLSEAQVDAYVNDNGYLTSYTETDPIFSASSASAIQGADITNWNSAFGWGDHSIVGYLTSYTETDPVYAASTASGIVPADITNWNSAFGWGDHSVAGYLDGSSSLDWDNITIDMPAGFADGIDNDSGGDITAVYADNGLTGGATSGDAHLNVGAGTGISVSANAVALNLGYTDGRYVSLSGSQTIGGTKTFSNQTWFTNGIYVPSPGPSTTNAVYVYNNSSSPTIWAQANQSTNAIRATNTSSSYPTIWARNYSSSMALAAETGNGNAIYAESSGASYPTVWGENTAGGYGGYFIGDLGATGTKTAMVETQSYGNRNLYADESAEVYFFDRGRGQLTNGTCVINLDPMFLETVTINDSYPMLVQITLTADCKGVFVSEKTNSNFTVTELQGRSSNATFDWEVAAKRKGYEDTRMGKITFVEDPQVEIAGDGTESGEEGIASPTRGVRIIRGE